MITPTLSIYQRTLPNSHKHICQIPTPTNPRVPLKTPSCAQFPNIRYTADYTLAEKYEWGRNRGCSFLTPNCSDPSLPEFCSDPYLTCTADTHHLAFCKNTLFSNNCKQQRFDSSCLRPSSNTQFYETRDSASQCHRYKNTMGINAGCFETQCDFAQGTYRLLNKDEFFPFDFECKFENQEHLLVNHNLTLYCSDPKHICKQKYECPQNCNGRGTCLENNTCFCDFFYEGQLCGSFKQCTPDIMSICNQLKTKNLISELEQTNDYATALTVFTQAITEAEKMTLTSDSNSATDSTVVAPSNDTTTVLSGTSLSTNINNENTDSATDSTNSTATTTSGDSTGQTESNDITQTGNHTEHTMDKGNSGIRVGMEVLVGCLAMALALA